MLDVVDIRVLGRLWSALESERGDVGMFGGDVGRILGVVQKENTFLTPL